MNLRYLIFIFIFNLFLNKGRSQNCQAIDAIKPALERALDKKVKDSILYFINQIPKNETTCLQEYLVGKIKYFYILKTTDSALSLLSELSLSLKKNYNLKIKMQELYLKGQYNYYTSSNDSASFYYIKTLELARQNKDTSIEIKALGSISNVFANLKQFDKAISYSKQAINLAKKVNNKNSEISLMSNLFTFYGKRYQETNELRYLDSAEITSKQLVVEAKKHHKIYELLKAYSGLGSCYFQYEKYNLTLAYSDSIIQFADKDKHARAICQAYANICDSYLSLGQFQKAKTAADSALIYANIVGENYLVSEVYYKLYDCENELKNYGEALNYYKKYSALQDSIRSEEQFSIVNDLEQKYNKAENERKISDLTKEQEISSLRINLLVTGIGLALFAIALVFYIYRQRSLKQKHTILLTEQRLNRSRINPHFFFNAIGALQNVIINENDKVKLIKDFSSFTKLMRQTLESSYHEFTTIEKEIEFINHYNSIQLLRNQELFKNTYKIDEEIETEDVVIPSMLLQPFIENSIEHGFKNITSGGEIIIEFKKAENNLIIHIIDNGSGFDSSSKENKHISRATQITTDRLFLLNEIKKSNSTFAITENKPRGTKIEIILPLLYKNEITHH